MFWGKHLASQLKTLPLLIFTGAVVSCLVVIGLAAPQAGSAADNNGFSLQVSPSPLIATVEPGQTTTLVLHIRNTSDQSQDLKMGLRAFTVDGSSGQVKLGITAPKDVSGLVSFDQLTFSIDAGAIFDQNIRIAIPASAGFTYSFAITISQQHPPKAQSGSTAINGSVAVFTLLNVDKPGATRKLELNKLSVGQHVYEYLPATVEVSLKNSGNTLVQPKGTIYIQRHSSDTKPLAAIDLNANGGYILPGSNRSLQTTWKDGFPHYESKTDAQGKAQRSLSWQGGNIGNLRIGRYVAKVVAVYDDGGHDVPLNAEVTFWVIPWRFLLFGLLIVVICLVGLYTIVRKSSKVVPRPRKKHGTAED